MRSHYLTKSLVAIVAAAFLVTFSSCDLQEKPLQEEAAYVAEDVISDYAFEDADDLAGLAMLSDAATAGGRVSGEPRVITINDPRCNCDNLVVTITMDPESTPEHPIGTIVIDFGDGCTGPLGNVRKGKIIVNFNGRRFLPGSYITTTFDGYSINDIALEGIRTLTNISESTENFPAFEIQLEGGKATWPDGTIATREHCFVREWQRASNPINDQLVVSQCADREVAASGTNRRGRAYTMVIVEPLVYKRGCPIAVSGIKEFTDVTSGKVITVDYGDGDCDRTVTITFNGQSRTFEVDRRG
ncbi:MAG: hypothetical protein KatS3mg032_0369 [Cyclobacteriaceae bacterium]|nr:MAG: hypothetical protein KatS3mg032_0369 [Cyclobacteriaceae bacterium]